jgi:hypothetical protein
LTTDGINNFHWAVWSADLPTCRFVYNLLGDGTNRSDGDGTNRSDGAGTSSGNPSDAATRTNVFAVNRWGCSAAHWGSATGSVELCQWLVQGVGIDFSARNHQGHDAFDKAAWNGHDELVRWLCALEFTTQPQVPEEDAPGGLASASALHLFMARSLAQVPSPH